MISKSVPWYISEPADGNIESKANRMAEWYAERQRQLWICRDNELMAELQNEEADQWESEQVEHFGMPQ